MKKQPFIPEKSKKPLTDISTFTLNTEKRYEERQTFELHLKEKADEISLQRKLVSLFLKLTHLKNESVSCVPGSRDARCYASLLEEAVPIGAMLSKRETLAVNTYN